MNEVELTDVESLIELLKGSYIVGGEKGEEGMHLDMSSGHRVMFIGQFVVGVLRGEEEIIH